MSGASNDGEGELPRKRVRKGTKSCWECKRRKIKCQLSSEDVPICSGCVARGTACTSQEFPEEREASSSGSNHMGDRLARIERMMETLLAKVTMCDDEDNHQKVMLTPESVGTEGLTPHPTHSVSSDSPFVGLYDNAVTGHRDIGVVPQTPIPPPDSRTPNCRLSKTERVRQSLLELLPSQKDMNLIFENSASWFLMQATANLTSTESSPTLDESIRNIAEVRKKNATGIARTLLHAAVCLQQLDSNFDVTQLQLFPSPKARMERYISTVQALVTSDDEIVSSVEGLECLMLIGLYQINAGTPRRGWLTFRRSLNMCQLMGFHKREMTNVVGTHLWDKFVQADRYLALLLGLPCGSTNDTLGPHETFKNPHCNIDHLFMSHLSLISARLIERNQTEFLSAYAATQDIDEQIEKLAQEVPSSWWDIPVIDIRDRSGGAAIQFDRLMSHIWYFQLQALLHLPFMLKSATDHRYAYSRFSCLKASREMTYRYLALRQLGSRFCCKVVDFSALTAVVTLFLGLLDSSAASDNQEQRNQRNTDRKMIEEVLESMEFLARGGVDIVAVQSVNVIKSLLAVESSSANQNLKITIPYFGTLNIARPQQVPKLNPECGMVCPSQNPPVQIDQQLPSQDWEGISAQYDTMLPLSSHTINHPMVQFTSSQYPSMIPDQGLVENWAMTEADTLLFDSLLNTDIEGNWIY